MHSWFTDTYATECGSQYLTNVVVQVRCPFALSQLISASPSGVHPLFTNRLASTRSGSAQIHEQILTILNLQKSLTYLKYQPATTEAPPCSHPKISFESL